MAVTVSIPSFEEGKPVLYNVSVDIGDGVPPYMVKRRFNDFLKLTADVESEMGEPVAVPPPRKPALWERVDLEARRRDLEIMLTALLRTPDFASTLAVGNFLELFQRRRAARASVGGVRDWVSTVGEISKLIGDARSSSGGVSYARQRIVQARALASQLKSTLSDPRSKEQLGPGEHARRKQQIDGLLLSLTQLENRSIESGADKRNLLFGIDSQQQQPQQVRVLGETSETRKMNNSELLRSQQSEMDDQDAVIGEMLVQVSRQKELGLAINEELVRQNELLTELDADVHAVNARLNEARRRTDKLNR